MQDRFNVTANKDSFFRGLPGKYLRKFSASGPKGLNQNTGAALSWGN
jgi:hypothetical protein